MGVESREMEEVVCSEGGGKWLKQGQIAALRCNAKTAAKFKAWQTAAVSLVAAHQLLDCCLPLHNNLAYT